jgi:hypothetical protein
VYTLYHFIFFIFPTAEPNEYNILHLSETDEEKPLKEIIKQFAANKKSNVEKTKSIKKRKQDLASEGEITFSTILYLHRFH